MKTATATFAERFEDNLSKTTVRLHIQKTLVEAARAGYCDHYRHATETHILCIYGGEMYRHEMREAAASFNKAWEDSAH